MVDVMLCSTDYIFLTTPKDTLLLISDIIASGYLDLKRGREAQAGIRVLVQIHVAASQNGET